MKLSQLGEFGLIEEIKRTVGKSAGVTMGIGDDTAVVAKDKKRALLLTTDMLIEGVHFTSKDLPRSIGHKALASNLSDIAAMGGTPKYALVSLGISPTTSLKRVKGIYQGMQSLARRYGVSIVGGDTNRSKGALIINIALTGEANKAQVVLRCGAKVGDGIFVTGALGNSYNSKHHLNFTPRLKEAALLVKKYSPHAMIDISDGLVADLYHILEASGVGARLYEEAIPRRRVGARHAAPLHSALYDGEDFELLFTLSRQDAHRIMKARPFKVHCIGEITARKAKLELIKKNGKSVVLKNKGFRHF